ncbi:hypothetical protein IBX73_06735 [candidate division WOR-3 bacterium]|nr:hypothetical protein [candidate division WOR-3 bacterium]
MPDIVEMHLKLLFDLDNLISDMEDESYKKIGFQIEEAASDALINKRNQLLRQLPRELGEIYEILKKRYRQAIAPVESEFCLGCFQKLPTQLAAQSQNILTCPNCGRILYWRPKN